MGVEIPLFPLGVVLFPHMPLSLHIFEERYRAMMRDCLADGTSFGVVAVEEGHRRSAAAAPYPVGTLAQFRDVESLPDGRFRLEVTGASRFQILDLIEGRPYLRASVRYLEDRPADDESSLARLTSRTAGAYETYLDTLGELNGDAATELPSGDDPELLSYQMAAGLQVELAVRQSLLELDCVSDRLREGLSLLRRETAILAAMLKHRDDPARAFSPN